MAQQFPTSAQVIYETLASDTVFTDLLGTYNFRAGQTTTALSIVTAGEDMPALRKVEGVECIIQDASNFAINHYLSDKDGSRLAATWSVFLVAWEPSTGADLQRAAERACSRFLGSQAIQTVATSDGLGSLVQTKLLIKSDMPILAA